MGGKPYAAAGEKRPPPQHDENEKPPTTKKRRRYEEKPQRANRRTERREVMANAKSKWEQLRPKATTKDKSVKLVADLAELLNGRIIEFVFRHDGSRIVQWMLAEGNESQKRSVMKELMSYSGENDQEESQTPFFVRLACDRYGHHLAFKMLRVSNKENKTAIFERYLRGNTASMIKSSHGADVLDFAYQTILSGRQRSELVIELLYSRERKLLDVIRAKLGQDCKTGKATGVKSVFAESLKLVDETFRDVVVESAAATISQLLDKESLLRFEVLHAAVKEYLMVVMESYAKGKAIDMAAQLATVLVHFAHTKAGMYVAVSCVKILDAKHRKKVVRGLKTHIRKILENEYGHRLILGMFEWIDDTRLVGKTVSTEMLSSSSLDAVLNDGEDSHKTKRGGRSKAEKKGKSSGGEKNEAVEDEGGFDLDYVRDMMMHRYGRMIFVNLFCGRDTRYFHPDGYGMVWERIDEEKFGKTSKKDEEVRRQELRGMFEKAVKKVMKRDMRKLLQNPLCCGIVIGACQVEETREGVMNGVTTCLQDEESFEEVVGTKCGRKSLATLIKVGGQEMWGKIVGECGVELVERLWTREECITIAERLVTKSDWKEGMETLERLRKETMTGGEA